MAHLCRSIPCQCAQNVNPPQELFPGGYAPTPAHFLLRLLSERGLLLRVFTQNIDGLEQLAGVPADKVVAAHGSFDSEPPAPRAAPLAVA